MAEDFPSEEQVDSPDSVTAVASALHEDWRKTRQKEDGTFEPRVKPTKDEAWIASHGGATEVDIANTEYPDLPEDWQAENKAAAEVVVALLEEAGGAVDVNDPAQRAAAGARIHDAWLARNPWAADSEQGVPFEQLPPEEQAKDIDQVVMAQQVLGQEAPPANPA